MTPPFAALFRPEAFFVGPLSGWVVVEGPLGSVRTRSIVSAQGKLAQDGAILFNEVWTFDDGSTDQLDWTISTSGVNLYQGRESTLIGMATGRVDGFRFHWRYSRTLKAFASSLAVNVDDCFYLIAPHACIVKGTISKLGMPLGRITGFYRKE